MNPLKIFAFAALAFSVVSAQDTAPVDESIAVTKAQLDALITQIKALAANDPNIAAIFNSIDLDALLKLTPEQARQMLNDKVFNASPPPMMESANSTTNSSASTSGSSTGSGNNTNAATTAPPSTDAIGTPTPAVPTPAPTSGASTSFLTATTMMLAAGVAITLSTL